MCTYNFWIWISQNIDLRGWIETPRLREVKLDIFVDYNPSVCSFPTCQVTYFRVPPLMMEIESPLSPKGVILDMMCYPCFRCHFWVLIVIHDLWFLSINPYPCLDVFEVEVWCMFLVLSIFLYSRFRWVLDFSLTIKDCLWLRTFIHENNGLDKYISFTFTLWFWKSWFK